MATSCSIAAKMSDGKVGIIYCHYDGYFSGVGSVLEKHYLNQDKIEKLISLGNICALGESIECPEGHSFISPVNDHTIAYGRDRGDENQEPYFSESYEGARIRFNRGIHFHYYWNDQEWQFSRSY